VKVDDVDPNGKVSLSLASAVEIPDGAVSSGGGGRDRDRDRAPRGDAPSDAGGAEVVSFEESFDAEVRQEFGDLGPAATTDGGGRGGERRGGDRGRRSGGGGGGRGGRR
jgi:polyribonucleotide nucleotidyltransferase